MPKTFQDAVELCRALDIRYLWIDSLCIIQDDDADWLEHVNTMAEIDSNAFITVAAGASDGAHGGLFKDADPDHAKAMKVSISSEDTTSYVYVRHRLKHLDENIGTMGWWGVDRQMPLMTRSWVVQEHLLSRRYLTFAPNEVLWQCKVDVGCSCSAVGQSGFNELLTPQGGKENPPSFIGCRPAKGIYHRLEHGKLWEAYYEWHRMVEVYTHRKLTFPRDKLAALEGIARRYKVSVKSALPQCLC